MRVCVYSTFQRERLMPHLISCDWKCNRGIDVQFVQWDILSQGLKSGLVFFFVKMY